MKDYKPIACSSYDYLEIACMDRYEVELQLPDKTVTGVADGMQTKDGQEFLLLTDTSGEEIKIRVDQIGRLRVITRPARFTEFQFAGTE